MLPDLLKCMTIKEQGDGEVFGCVQMYQYQS